MRSPEDERKVIRSLEKETGSLMGGRRKQEAEGVERRGEVGKR